MVLAKFLDRRSFPDHSQNIWSTITQDPDWQKLEKYDLGSLMIVIWLEMISDHDPIRLTLHMSYIFCAIWPRNFLNLNFREDRDCLRPGRHSFQNKNALHSLDWKNPNYRWRSPGCMSFTNISKNDIHKDRVLADQF